MTALLRKDIYTLIKQTRVFLVLILIFAVLPGKNMSTFAVVYAAMLPITAMAYDERSKWDQLALMMPYSTRQLVCSKYILGYAAIAATTIITLLVRFLLPQFRGGTMEEVLFPILLMVCFVLILLAADLPLMFRIGVEKGRLAYLALMVLLVLGAGMFSGGLLNEFVGSKGLTQLTLIAFAVAVVLNILSIFLSIRGYRKRFA